MKITVIFESLDEFESHMSIAKAPDTGVQFELLQEAINAQNELLIQETSKLKTAVENTYHAGDDIIGGKVEVSFTDSDLLELDGTVHHDLLKEVHELMAKVDQVDDKFNENVEEQIIYKVTGSYSLRNDLNRPTLKALIKELTNMHHRMS